MQIRPGGPKIKGVSMRDRYWYPEDVYKKDGIVFPGMYTEYDSVKKILVAFFILPGFFTEEDYNRLEKCIGKFKINDTYLIVETDNPVKVDRNIFNIWEDCRLNERNKETNAWLLATYPNIRAERESFFRYKQTVGACASDWFRIQRDTNWYRVAGGLDNPPY